MSMLSDQANYVLYICMALAFTHFVGDFLLQTDSMALNKSKQMKWLLAHTYLYSACFLPFGLRFALITLILHTVTDFFTSRWTSKLWFMDEAATMCGKCCTDPIKQNPVCWRFANDGRRHWFFSVIGLDQLIHAVTLILTWKVLNG